MNPTDTTDPSQVSSPIQKIDSELAHITKEMYKQNAELAVRNKTLSLLRKIDQIVLSKVTDTKEIALQVAGILILEAEFLEVSIYLLDRADSTLKKIAISRTELAEEEARIHDVLFSDVLQVNDQNNPIVKSVVTQKPQIMDCFAKYAYPEKSLEEATEIEKSFGIKSSIILPLIVRNESIGTLVIGLGEHESTLSVFKRDLIDRLSGVIGIAIDNALLYQNTQEANERLKELDRLKDEFVSLASHELRTPMTVIKSYIWLLLDTKQGPINEKQKTYLERTFSSVERLINLVNDMLNVSRIESGRMLIEKEDVDIENLVATTLEELKAKSDELGLKLLIDKKSESISHVLVDPDKIKQVLLNLVGNSLKFTPAGGSVTVSLDQKDGFVTIAIIDTGQGINPEDVGKLFKKFGMIGKNYLSKQGTQGTGLGLYLTKSIVELHGGSITVESQGEGKGTTFTFTIPTKLA